MANPVSDGEAIAEAELSLEEFMALPAEEGCRLELSHGRVVREPAPGPRHGDVAGRIYRILWAWAERRAEGFVFFDVGFVLGRNPLIVRMPDVAFVASDRAPPEGLTDRFWELAPDLAVEVVSPSNRASDTQRKALEYLDAGAGMVWVVDPAEWTVAVYRSRSDIRILASGEGLDGGEVLPELEVPLRDLFE